MTPADYMNEIVVATLRDFRDDRRSRRQAYLACIAVFHLKDHLKKVGVQSVENRMRGTCGIAFDVVRGVCNGTKHVETSAKHVVAFRVGDDTDRPPGVWDEAVWDVSRFDDADGGREVQHGVERHDVYECAKAVAAPLLERVPPKRVGLNLIFANIPSGRRLQALGPEKGGTRRPLMLAGGVRRV